MSPRLSFNQQPLCCIMDAEDRCFRVRLQCGDWKRFVAHLRTQVILYFECYMLVATLNATAQHDHLNCVENGWYELHGGLTVPKNVEELTSLERVGV